MGQLILLLGGARSGKSHYAEQWAQENGQQVLFVATAQAYDDDMRVRIKRHRADRPAHWGTLEAPIDTAAQIEDALAAGAYDTLVLDCITLLASNVLLSLPEDCTQEQVNTAVVQAMDDLLRIQNLFDITWLIVSNEVGMGIVPHTRLGRMYRDALGRANQRLAQAADEVVLLVAGLPWHLKP